MGFRVLSGAFRDVSVGSIDIVGGLKKKKIRFFESISGDVGE